MNGFSVLIAISIIVNASFSYHTFDASSRPLKESRRQPSRRQVDFFGSGFNWDNSESRPNFNNFDRDRVFFQDDNRNPWNPGRDWGRPVPNDLPRPGGSEVPVPGMGTTRSPCEDTCQVTREYNPVCGTNGITYTNDRWLRCAQNCGRRVDISYYGSCPRVG